jgi:hypothetical protein
MCVSPEDWKEVFREFKEHQKAEEALKEYLKLESKIKLYQRIRDRQAVLGVGRWYASARIQVHAIQ